METSPLPDFPLEPHEIPPSVDVPLVAPAQAKIEWEGREILIRAVKIEKEKWVVFLRDEGKNWIVLLADEAHVLIRKLAPSSQKKLESIALAALTPSKKQITLGRIELFAELALVEVAEIKHKNTRINYLREQERLRVENPELYEQLRRDRQEERERRRAKENRNNSCCGCWLLILLIAAWLAYLRLG